MGTLLSLAKRIGKDHALATALWESGWYEARMLAALVDDAHRVTRRQMNAWAGDFDNWAICNTVWSVCGPPLQIVTGMAPRYDDDDIMLLDRREDRR